MRVADKAVQLIFRYTLTCRQSKITANSTLVRLLNKIAAVQGRNAQTKDSADVAHLAAQTLIRRYTEESESLLPHVKELIQDHSLSASSSQALVPAKSPAKASISKA